MRFCKALFCSGILCLLFSCVTAQDTAKIYPQERIGKRLHPGLIASTGPYFLLIKASGPHSDSLKYIHSNVQTEFGMGIALEYKLSTHFSLLFSPSVIIVNYDLNYLFANKEWYNIGANGISSTIELPLDVEFFFNRHKNHNKYILAGAGIKKLINTAFTSDQGYIPLNPNEYCLEAGGGMEFYMHHFKIKIQGKYSVGLDNMLLQPVTDFGETVAGVYSSEVLFSIALMSY
ncbi:MAG TPA: hypothetical protein VK806_06325 [Bacteroidia bacterium]|jgi:hypothetical protein|nr:hypothetical protein [Bacteroidia bacterium]